VCFLANDVRDSINSFKLTERNFYGVLRVSDPDDPTADGATRTLTNGTINHGEQFLDPKRRRQPTTYYGPDSGVGLAIREAQARGPARVGVIGLGTGTLACYGRAQDWFRFYDINPQVVQVANSQFTFLRDCPAAHDVVLGDARLSLEREPSQQFDVLAVDAFAGDSIPIHLLTQEAFALYFRHLKPGGVLAVHVSNLYLDLTPVVALSAQSVGKEARLVETTSDEDADLADTDWVLVTARPAFWTGPLLKSATQPITTRRRLRLWTDDYSNLYQIVKSSPTQ
jgi:SAM-dependent methyltransferase